MKLGYLIPVVCLGLCACSTPTQTILAELAVQRGVYEVVKDDPTRADRIVEILDEVDSALVGDMLTAAPLINLVKQKINWNRLAPPDQQLVNSLLDLLQVELDKQLAKLNLPSDRVLQVRTVAGWVRETAELYDSTP